MARTTNDKIAPFTVGVSLTNGDAAIANYNVFIITLREGAGDATTGNPVGNFRSTFVYSRGVNPANYGTMLWNSSYEYWCWYQISLSGNTFSATGKRDYSVNSGGETINPLQILKIYGVC